MKSIALGIMLMTGLFNCGGKDAAENAPSCSHAATVRDFTGLDGCGLMFVLEDGTHLMPERRTYVTAPSMQDDPMYYYEMKAGDEVKLSYDATNLNNVCMAGTTGFVTCLTKIN